MSMASDESRPAEGDNDYQAKLQRALTPEMIAAIRALPERITEDDIPAIAQIAASLGIFGNDPFPLPLIPSEDEDKEGVEI